MPEFTRTFTFDKETRHYFRFLEQTKPDQPVLMKQVYISKNAFRTKPESLTVTVAVNDKGGV